MKANASLASLIHRTRAQHTLPIKTLNQAVNIGLSKECNQTETMKNGLNGKELTLPASLPNQFSAAVARYLEIFNLSGLDESDDDDDDDDDMKDDKLVKTTDESNLLGRATCSDSPASEDQKPKLPEPSQVGTAPKAYEDMQGVLKSVGLNFDVPENRALSTHVQEQSHLSQGSVAYPECSNTAQSSNHLSQSEALETHCAIYKATDVKCFGQQNPSTQQGPASVLGQQKVDLSLGQQNSGTVLQNPSVPFANGQPVLNVPVPPCRVPNYAAGQTPLTYEQSSSGPTPAYEQYLPAPDWSGSSTIPPQFNIAGSVQTLPPHNSQTAVTTHSMPARAPLSDEKNEEFQKQKVIEERFKLMAERNNIQMKIALLQKELPSVRKELGALMHVEYQKRSGYKDPALQKVRRAYDDIQYRLSVLTREGSLAAEKQFELDAVAKILGVDDGKTRKQHSENQDGPSDMDRWQECSRSPEKRERSTSQENRSRSERSRSHERANKRERSRSKEKSSRRERSKSQEAAKRAERSRSSERASRVERSRSRERASKREHSRSRDKPTKRERLSRHSQESGPCSQEMSPTPIKDACPNSESSSVRPLKTATRLSDSAISSAEPYEYYDAGNHWCRECNSFCRTLLDFFSHMHHKKHQKTLDPDSKPWAEKTQGESAENSANTGNKVAVPAKGSEFLIPLRGFYCTLCDEMLADQTSCAKHVKCGIHNRNYKKYIESNLLYEERRSLDRQAGIAASMQAKQRREREIKRRLEETYEDEKHKESTKMNLLKSQTDKQHVPYKPAPFVVSPIESIKLCTANEDLSGRGEMEDTKGTQMQTGKTKPITIKIAKKPLPSMQAKIRPDLPAPTMVQRNSGVTNLNKPIPLNTFLSIKSGLTSTFPPGKPVNKPVHVVASNMPNLLKVEGNNIPCTEASSTPQKPPISVVYEYGVKVLNKSNVGTGTSPVQKPLDRGIMFPASSVHNEKGVTHDLNDPYSILQTSAGAQDPYLRCPAISMETGQPSSVITKTNICIGSANTQVSSIEISENLKSVGSGSCRKWSDICPSRQSQAHSSSTFAVDEKRKFLALEGMQQQSSEAVTNVSPEASVTLDSLLPCQSFGDINAPGIKSNAHLQQGCISRHSIVSETNDLDRKEVDKSLTIGLENKIMLGLMSNMLDISSESVLPRNEHPSQDAEEGHGPLDVSHAVLAPVQLDEKTGSCVIAPEPSEYVKNDVLVQHDGGTLDADMPAVSVEEDFEDSDLEEQAHPEPKTSVTVYVAENDSVCSPAPAPQVPDSVDDEPESPDTSEEAAYISD